MSAITTMAYGIQAQRARNGIQQRRARGKGRRTAQGPSTRTDKDEGGAGLLESDRCHRDSDLRCSTRRDRRGLANEPRGDWVGLTLMLCCQGFSILWMFRL
jgi:hypothetical protein